MKMEEKARKRSESSCFLMLNTFGYDAFFKKRNEKTHTITTTIFYTYIKLFSLY